VDAEAGICLGMRYAQRDLERIPEPSSSNYESTAALEPLEGQARSAQVPPALSCSGSVSLALLPLT
jgi:hypothetical protein